MGNLDNFIGTIDPENPFSGKSPRQDGLLDEIVDGAWYRITYDQCKNIAGNEPFLVLGVVMYCDKTGTDVYLLLHLPFSTGNVITNLRLGMYLVIFRILR